MSVSERAIWQGWAACFHLKVKLKINLERLFPIDQAKGKQTNEWVTRRPTLYFTFSLIRFKTIDIFVPIDRLCVSILFAIEEE